MSNADWMGVISKCVNEFDMDIEMTMRQSADPYKPRTKNALEKM